jgi:HlyD family type I secretion membrane fusion protein
MVFLPTSPSNTSTPSQTPMANASSTLKTGVFIAAMFFGVTGIWSVFAKLESSVLANGELVYAGDRREIQHLEGGIVREIRVRDGDLVQEGDALIVLSDVEMIAQRNAIRAEYHEVLGRLARLRAERENVDVITFDQELLSLQGDPKVSEILDMQTDYFQSRRSTFEGQTEILAGRIPQYDRMIAGLDAQIGSITKQLDITDEEIKDVEKLVDRGIERKPRLLALQKSQADLQGKMGELTAQKSQTGLAISEVEMRLSDMQITRISEVESELTPLLSRALDLTDRLAAAEDRLERTVVRSPITGFVHSSQVHTIAAVIRPGDTLLSIVPKSEDIIISARVRPIDIDKLVVGGGARIMLSAFKQNEVPPLEGEVLVVSADRLQDEATGQSYFAVRVAISEADFLKIQSEWEIELLPGMPADVYIRTGFRSPLDYFMQPLRESFSKAFRET